MLRPALQTLVERKQLIGCEVGVGAGKNALSILKGLDIAKLYLVDPYMKYKGTSNEKDVRVTNATCREEEARRRLNGYESKIVWIRDLSSRAVDEIDTPLDFVYIDGNHFYDYVLEDIRLYTRIVKVGGLVSGHDYEMDGREYPHHFCNVRDPVNLCAENWGFVLKTYGSDWWFIKDRDV